MKSRKNHGLFKRKRLLLDVFAQRGCELEHVDRSFADDLRKFSIRYDHALIFRVLAFVFLDVDPQLFDHLRTGHFFAPDNGCKLF